MSFKAESSRDEREWAPPMHGTAWFTTRLIEPDDPTSFEAAVSKPTSSRTMFDRRENGWVEHWSVVECLASLTSGESRQKSCP